jgi:predicted dehydrogenase
MDNKESTDGKLGTTRRDFIKKTTSIAAAVAATNIFKTPVYGQDKAPSTGRVIGANDRINVAVIGMGVGIGQNHFKGINDNANDNNVAVVAAADLFSKRREMCKDPANGPGLKDADIYLEYERVLDRKDVDAVVIATHDIWHMPISIAAIQAGKHVYCEKPMTRYLGEAFKVYDTVKASKLTFQIGAQGTSAGGWNKCAELVKAGKIGTLVWSQGYYCRNSKTGEWNDPPFVVDPDSSATTIDWDRWQKPVHNKIAFNGDHFHRWRKYYPYCAGVLGDLAPHRLHPLMLASGEPEFPKRVVSIGTHNVHAEKPDMPERDIPEHQQLLAEFPSGYLITLTCGTVNAKSPGFVIYGHKATLNIGEGGNRVDIVPERDFGDEIDPDTFDGLQREDIRYHEKNFFDCIRTGKTPNGNIDLAVRCQTVLSLAEMSNRLNMVCLFDDKTRTITDGNGKVIEAITYGTLPLS